ncbi:hypothetical protein CI102_9383 [Trichoderma harzianum]|nr:hypothetical protein CI102_9383 [Trichoderma harzianum]
MVVSKQLTNVLSCLSSLSLGPCARCANLALPAILEQRSRLTRLQVHTGHFKMRPPRRLAVRRIWAVCGVTREALDRAADRWASWVDKALLQPPSHQKKAVPAGGC